MDEDRPLPQLFRCIGSKQCLTAIITALVPPDTHVLVSLFMGNGAFEYNYARSHPQCRVRCYDLDPAVVNFHRIVLRDRLALHARIQAQHARLCRRDGGAAETLSKGGYMRLLDEQRSGAERAGVPAAARFYILCACVQ